MSRFKKNVLSLITALLFFVFAVASKVNKIHYGAFNANTNVEDKTDTRNYLLKNDGSKLYGGTIKWKTGILTKNWIAIDDDKFRMNEIYGYRANNVFYIRQGSDYVKRIVHGKINVYIRFTLVTSTNTSSTGRMETKTYTRTDHYAQKGDHGDLIGIASQKDIKGIVSDCPTSVAMIDISSSKIRKAIRNDPNYLNEIFEIYNNNCTQLK